MLAKLMENLEEIRAFLKPYGFNNLKEYLDLSDGAPTEPLTLPPKHMDLQDYKKMAESIDADIQAARDERDTAALNIAIRARWNHLFVTRPMDVADFRTRLGALLEQRCALMRDMKCGAEWMQVVSGRTGVEGVDCIDVSI